MDGVTRMKGPDGAKSPSAWNPHRDDASHQCRRRDGGSLLGISEVACTRPRQAHCYCEAKRSHTRVPALLSSSGQEGSAAHRVSFPQVVFHSILHERGNRTHVQGARLHHTLFAWEERPASRFAVSVPWLVGSPPQTLLTGFVSGNDQGRPLQVQWQNLEQEMRIGLARLVVDAVADITGLEKEITSAV